MYCHYIEVGASENALYSECPLSEAPLYVDPNMSVI